GHIRRHLVTSKRLQASPQPFKLRGVDARADAAGVDQPPVTIIVGEQQRPEMRPPSDRGTVRLLTRTGLDWTHKYPPIAAAVASLGARRAYLDGELCGVLPDGLTSFSMIQAASDAGMPLELGGGDAGARVAGIGHAPLRIVMG